MVRHYGTLGKCAKHAVLTLFNKSLRTGIVPQSWRHGVIIPLLKPGKKATELASYRPVTLTSCLCKLMERIVAARIRDAIESKPTPQQSGFRPSHSTLNQLLHLRAVMHRPTPKDRTAAVFVNYAKTFDTVDNDKIILAMRRRGVPPHIVRWSASFLRNRAAVVRVNKVRSSAVSFTRGVPQGTVLGPLMLIIVMNFPSLRLAEAPLLRHGFFADDLTLIARHSDREILTSTPQRGLNVVASCAMHYFMKANATETKYTFFGTKSTNPVGPFNNGTPVTMERLPAPAGHHILELPRNKLPCSPSAAANQPAAHAASGRLVLQLGVKGRHTACLLLGPRAGQSNVWYRSTVLGRITHLASYS
ncbi:Tbingi protein [Trypanosoma grayi]|uniref:Tbingi protein n=1 Tax=Trypanosoma grayi TaxID=71804 RepID=UPI0004F4831E|nr:Tbingi protein [Trypanosoma grayi]KEG07383.1 Tbingi protein [Trypanosoma grayi]